LSTLLKLAAIVLERRLRRAFRAKSAATGDGG
jgi:hypothetical protein